MEANARLRYQRSESKHLKAERNRYKKALCATRAELDEQKRRNALPMVTGKVDVIFLALALFLVAHIGFCAVSRVLAFFASVVGWDKTPCPQTVANWVARLSLSRMSAR